MENSEAQRKALKLLVKSIFECFQREKSLVIRPLKE